MGTYEPVAVYNPVLHNMLIGSGAGALDSTFFNTRTFYILTYNPSSLAWSVSSTRMMPAITIACAPNAPFIMDSSGGVSHVTVDPITGKYIVMTREGNDCHPVMYQYDSEND